MPALRLQIQLCPALRRVPEPNPRGAATWANEGSTDRTEPGPTGGTGRGYLKLSEPSVSSSATRLRVVTRGEARVGTPIGDNCLAPLQWDGFIEVFEEPRLSADEHVLGFRVVQSNIYDSAWKKRLL